MCTAAFLHPAGPAPTVSTPTDFNTAAADAVLAAMQIFPVTNTWVSCTCSALHFSLPLSHAQNEDISSLPVVSTSAAITSQVGTDLTTTHNKIQPQAEMNYLLVPSARSACQRFCSHASSCREHPSSIHVTTSTSNSLPHFATACSNFVNYADQSDGVVAGPPSNGMWGNYPIPTGHGWPLETWPTGARELLRTLDDSTSSCSVFALQTLFFLLGCCVFIHFLHLICMQSLVSCSGSGDPDCLCSLSPFLACFVQSTTILEKPRRLASL